MWPSSGEEGLDVGLNVGSAVKGGRNGSYVHTVLVWLGGGGLTRRKRTGRGGDVEEEKEEETSFLFVPWKWVF